MNHINEIRTWQDFYEFNRLIGSMTNRKIKQEGNKITVRGKLKIDTSGWKMGYGSTKGE